MNNQDVGREGVAPDAEQCTPNDESDESKRNQTEPEGPMTKTSESRRLPAQDGDSKASSGGKCRHDDEWFAPRGFVVFHILCARATPNDLKLSDSGVRRGTCMVGGKVVAEAGAVTHGAVRCSAWLGVAAVVFAVNRFRMWVPRGRRARREESRRWEATRTRRRKSGKTDKRSPARNLVRLADTLGR